MRILPTGVDGYIGSLLGPLLLNAGHDVVGLDTGYYRDGWHQLESLWETGKPLWRVWA